VVVRLGFYTDYSTSIVKFASDTGFRSLELSAWPQSALNADDTSDERLAEIRRHLAEVDIEISALGYYPNYLDPDKELAEEAKRYLGKVLELAHRAEVPVVATFVGQIPGAPIEDCIDPIAEHFNEVCARAEQLGIQIAIENCPMLNHKTRHGENVAYSPEIWDALFAAVPSRAFGLELDPSHLVYLGIDYLQAVLDYGDRIFHVHAKDTDIDRRRRSRLGTFGQAIGDVPGFGNGWWRFRTPGFGEIDWAAFISALISVGYRGNIDIEHEDEVFAAAAVARVEGEADIVEMLGREPNALALGYRHLSQLIPPYEADELLPH
jgi:sugar phosphate isomerase/epimerase